MNTRKSFILFALFVIVFSLAACITGPKISNFYMAKDDQGTNKTTTFAPTDALILFFDVNGVRNGTPFEARWYVLNVAGNCLRCICLAAQGFVYSHAAKAT